MARARATLVPSPSQRANARFGRHRKGECDWMPDIRVVLVMGFAVSTSDHASPTDADRKQRGVDLCGPCERC